MDNFTPFIILSLILPILILLGMISVKLIRRKELPSNHYTPFDHIMGQSAVEFHVEKEEHEEQDDQGDDKNKNTRRT